jgi:hypothetical protein
LAQQQRKNNKTKQNKTINEIKMQLRVPQKERKKEKNNNHIVVDDEAPFDNIDDISSATTVRPDS